MKKFLFTGAILCAIAAGTTLTSCLGNDDPKQPDTFTANLPAEMNFTAVKALDGGAWQAFEGSSVRYMYNFSSGSMQFGVANMKIAPTQIITFSLPAIPITYDKDGAWSSTAAGPFTVSYQGQTHIITNLKTYLRIPANCPAGVKTEFEVDGEYLVRVMPTVNYFGGDTKTTNLADNSPYSTDITYYNMALDQKTMKAEMFIYRSRFVVNMPMFNLSFAEVPFKLTNDGITFESASLTPNVVTFKQDGSVDKRTPNERFKITDFSGSMSVAGKLDFSFNCDASGIGNFNATFSGTPLTNLPAIN